jgi:hypothetical protein
MVSIPVMLSIPSLTNARRPVWEIASGLLHLL